MSNGELAIVLHTHMPYVEGFGTWPFGEEWLWEAVATSYLPLVKLFQEHDTEAARRGGPLLRERLTLSLTPVLCDQLEAPGAMERCVRFLREVRAESHRLDIEHYAAAGDRHAVTELERSAAEYAAAAEALEALEPPDGLGLLAALGAHASWTSSATHALLPLLALDEGIALQLGAGIESHRMRFGEWDGGLWLPECGYAPWLAVHLADASVRSACVELTGTFGEGDARHLQPLQTDEGPLLWPVDRAVIGCVWAPDGYPATAGYRDYNGLTPRHHRIWSTGGGAYDHERARALTADHAREFVKTVKERVAAGGICVCALDTELLGHWWYEGVHWLAAVLAEADAQGLALTALDEGAVARHPAVAVPAALPPTSWGEGGDLRTWSAPQVADLAWQARAAELRTFLGDEPVPVRARRELLALQSSDWAFLAYRDWSGDYPRQRAAGHLAALERALTDPAVEPGLRNLAPYLA
jgi:1,4-alpha-glucan branching enzyme